jgi:hypothetical protein
MSAPHAARQHATVNAPASYPADLQLDAPPEIANWRPLVQWILAIPHLIIVNVLDNVSGVLALVSWFIILFTGKLPEGIARFQCLLIRYQARTYSYAFFLREQYPPFEFEMTTADPGTDPLRVDITPQLENRNRLTVGLRILWIIPILLFTAVVAIAAMVAMVVAFFATLFTGRWPESVRGFVLGAARLMVRTSVYGSLLTDEYPPFSLDAGVGAPRSPLAGGPGTLRPSAG